MKAAVFNEKHHIKVEEVSLRELKEHEVQVDVAYCGVCGTDLHIFHGDSGAAKVNPPTILGHEFSGIVAAVGSEVKHLAVGDRVSVDPNNMCGECYACQNGKAHFCSNVIGYGTTENGGFARKAIVAEKQAYKISDDLNLEEAAMTEPVSCCVHGIDLCNIKAGNTVLVMGAGPIGLIMIQLAKMSGAAKVIVSEPVEEKHALAIKLGADAVINPFTKDLYEELQKMGDNIDVVIECAGSTKVIEQAIQCAGKGATVMMFGLTAPEAALCIRPFEIFQKELHLTASFINPYTFKRALNILESKRINVKDIITDIIPLDQMVQVFTDDAYRRKGKIMICMNEEQ